MAEYLIDFLWDNEASVWVATSEDIPGLVLESGSFDALMERVRFAMPELLEMNGLSASPMISYRSQRQERVKSNHATLQMKL